MVAGVGLHPVPIIAGALAKHFLAHHREAQNLTDEINHLLRSRQSAQVAVNDDTVEAVVDKGQQISEQLDKLFHGPALYSPEREQREHGGPQNHEARIRKAMGGWQTLPPGR